MTSSLPLCGKGGSEEEAVLFRFVGEFIELGVSQKIIYPRLALADLGNFERLTKLVYDFL